MKKRILLTASLVLSTGCAFPLQASDTLVQTLSQGANAKLRANDPTGSGYTQAVGDFDGDGKPDHASLKLEKPGDTAFKLVVALSGEAGVERVLKSGENIQAVGIETAKPGRHKTACGKGAGAATADCVETVNLPHDGISLFTFESAAVVLYADEGGFKEVWVTD